MDHSNSFRYTNMTVSQPEAALALTLKCVAIYSQSFPYRSVVAVFSGTFFCSYLGLVVEVLLFSRVFT